MLREKLLTDNDGLCDLCGEPCYRPNLDHHHISYDNDFSTGAAQIRGTICQNCNVRLSGAENVKRVKYNHGELATWLRAAADYIEKYREVPSGIIHPSERSKLNKLKNYTTTTKNKKGQI